MQWQKELEVPAGKYRHYKGREYRVIGMALHSETMELMVVYQPLYETPDVPPGTLWVRPAAMFTEQVHVNGETMARFRKIED